MDIQLFQQRFLKRLFLYRIVLAPLSKISFENGKYESFYFCSSFSRLFWLPNCFSCFLTFYFLCLEDLLCTCFSGEFYLSFKIQISTTSLFSILFLLLQKWLLSLSSHHFISVFANARMDKPGPEGQIQLVMFSLMTQKLRMIFQFKTITLWVDIWVPTYIIALILPFGL